MGIDDERSIMVILGGSQGALQLNTLVWSHLEELSSMAYIVHQTGEATFKPVSHKNYFSVPFIEEGLHHILAAATLVISRAGATALGELIELGKPMILIPLGINASRVDQYYNASRLEQHHAAVVLSDSLERNFVTTVQTLLIDDEKRDAMRQNCDTLRSIDAEKRIAHEILDLVKR